MERQRADVGPDERNRSARFHAGLMQHRRRPIDADDVDARARERDRDASGTATELEYAAAGAGGETPPERNVAAAERLRVLPVVEARVLVPPFPPFADGIWDSGFGICPWFVVWQQVTLSRITTNPKSPIPNPITIA